MNWIDIGANLAHASFQKDLDSVLLRAHQAGIETIVVTGTSMESNHAALKLCENPHTQNPKLYCTAGLHPHEAKCWNDEFEKELKELLQHPLVKAVGECGLDFHRNFSEPVDQIKAFEAQLQLAIEIQKPLFLHERESSKTFIPILKTYRDQLQNCVVHCFTGTKQEAFAYLDLNCHIGVTGWICDERRGYHLHEFIKNVPLNRLMLETDAPYLLPRDLKNPIEARRNEPCYLPHIGERVALCYEISIEELSNAVKQTSLEFFKL